MDAPSKKLTVSFGAFACTLEGFDDPFPVMRQVVDYFQALASADPSFGAHPERPDTDYLKTLAQESAGGTVEAELSEGGMILRQSSGADIAPTLNAVEAEPVQLSADELMEISLADNRFEDVEFEPEQTDQEPQFEDVSEDWETDHTPDDLSQDAALQAEENVQGASLPDWAQDLIEDAIEHGEETETLVADPIAQTDPIAQEEAALERVLKATEDRTQVTPELHAANPLTQLRKDEGNTAQHSADEQELEDVGKLIADELSQSEQPDAQAEPSMEPEEVDDIFRAFAGLNETQQEAPISAAEILRQEVEREALAQKQEMQNPPVKHVLTASASTKSSGRPMRLKFDDNALPHAASNPASQTPAPKDPIDTHPAAQQPAEEELLVLTEAQVVENQAQILETPTLVLVPEDKSDLDEEHQLGEDLNAFAASVGAATLPELLEASAAYVTLVSGRPTFSRRDIMTLLDEMSEPNEFTQEARIKSFGKLLRGGSITRTENGHFTISDRALNSYEAMVGVA